MPTISMFYGIIRRKAHPQSLARAHHGGHFAHIFQCAGLQHFKRHAIRGQVWVAGGKTFGLQTATSRKTRLSGPLFTAILGFMRLEVLSVLVPYRLDFLRFSNGVTDQPRLL